MLYFPFLLSAIEVLIVTLPILFTVAFVTIAERKTMGNMQRRLGPNIVGYYGLLQAFADALKLLLKEYVSPTQANLILFFLGPIVTLIFSLLGYAVIPYAPGLSLFDFNLGVFYMLAVSSIATYGILLAGWSANSKYAFLGSLRSTAQLISYELVLSSAIFIAVLLTNSFNLTVNVEIQKAVLFIIPLFPIFVIFLIGAIAETNRAPFDLAEAESELVSGFMTEHSAVIFVFFFLAEYASIVLICILISIFYLGGYYINFKLLIYVMEIMYYIVFNFLLHTLAVICYILIWLLYPVIFTVNIFLGILTCAAYIFINLLLYIFSIFYTESESLEISWIKIFKSKLTNIVSEELKCLENLDSPFDMDFQIFINFDFESIFANFDFESIFANFVLINILCSFSMAIKTFTMIYIFIWVRASFPRIRFDELMYYCWTVLLPLVFAFIILIPCIIYVFEIIPYNIIFF